jgi:uncharacterized membrane protein YagU involved in acid resistance
MSMERMAVSRSVVGIVLGGLLAGVLDIVYAFVLAAMRGAPPLRVLHSVASGLLGSAAYQGGIATGTLGLVLHLSITVVAAWVFWFAVKRSPVMQGQVLWCGLVFGVLVYLFMNFVVLPLSAVSFQIKYSPAVIAQGFISHAALVGLPIAWCLRWFAFGAPSASQNAA